MSRAASGPHKCSAEKSWRQKTKSKFPHLTPLSGPRPVSCFSPFLCCKEHNVCCLAVINPSIVLDAIWSAHCSLRKYPSRRFGFCTKSDEGHEVARKPWLALIIAKLWLMFHCWFVTNGGKLWIWALRHAGLWVLCCQRTCYCDERGFK